MQHEWYVIETHIVVGMIPRIGRSTIRSAPQRGVAEPKSSTKEYAAHAWVTFRRGENRVRAHACCAVMAYLTRAQLARGKLRETCREPPREPRIVA